jgi:outer membrane biosynthesis protein TonB
MSIRIGAGFLVRVGVFGGAVLAGGGAARAQTAGDSAFPRLVSAEIGGISPNAQSGGVAACDVAVTETGAVGAVSVVQDMAPYSDALTQSLPRWRFEPAREKGQAVPAKVLVLWLARPPLTAFPAPANPRYKGTVAPDYLPWPTSIAVAPYPPGALGSGIVVLEADVSNQGHVTGTHRLSSTSAFDGAADDAARKWTFRPALVRNREAASRAVLIFSFAGTTR